MRVIKKAESQTAFETIRASLARLADVLGTVDPTEWLAGPLEATFRLPRYHRSYGLNKLTPGALPIELSFSEISPLSLRLDLELFERELLPPVRRLRTEVMTASLIESCFGSKPRSWFDEMIVELQGEESYPPCFGAFFGASFGRDGPEELKVYEELGGTLPRKLPLMLRERVAGLVAAMPSASPLFVRISYGRNGGSLRLYFVNRCEQGILQFGPLLESLGIAQSLPNLVSVLLPLTSGNVSIPSGALMASLSDSESGPDLKLELLLGRLPQSRAGTPMNSFFAGRPRSKAAFERWERALPTGGLRWSAAGVRVGLTNDCPLNFYASPWICP